MIRPLIMLVALAALTGCPLARRPPADIVVAAKPELPEWATAPLPHPRPVDGTVGALGASHDARGAVIDYADCRSVLIRRIINGEKIHADACAKSREPNADH